MIYLEEHREVGDGPDKAQALADAHAEYAKDAMVSTNSSSLADYSVGTRRNSVIV